MPRFEKLDPERRHDVVVNLQGDLPALDPAQIRAVAAALDDSGADIATLAARNHRSCRARQSQCGESGGGLGPKRAAGPRALFHPRHRARAAMGPCFIMSASMPIAATPWRGLSPCRLRRLETREKLEQLRALEANMSIAVARVDSVPLSVDTPADLENARGKFSHDQIDRPCQARRLSGRAGRLCQSRRARSDPACHRHAPCQLRGRDRGGEDRRAAISASSRWKIR